MPGPATPAIASTVLPPITWTAIVNEHGYLTPAGLNLFQQIWAAAFGGIGIDSKLPKPGDMKPIAGASGQTGWLICDGTAYLNETYPDLFAEIGTTWGTVGAGTFRVPNLRGNFVIGADGTHALGATGGALSRTIAQANLPAYTLPNTLGWAQDTGTSDKLGEAGASTPVTATGAVDIYPAANFGAQAITVTGHITGSVTSGGSGTALATTPTFAAVNWLIKT